MLLNTWHRQLLVIISEMSEKIKEEIKYYTEWLRLAIIIVISVAGFVVKVFFSTENKYSYKYLLLLSAIFLIFVLLIFVFKINRLNRKKLKEL